MASEEPSSSPCSHSRIWYIVGCLLLYILYMHSVFFLERHTMWHRWQAQWDTDWSQMTQRYATQLTSQQEAVDYLLLQLHQEFLTEQRQRKDMFETYLRSLVVCYPRQ